MRIIQHNFKITPVQQSRPRARRFGNGISMYDPKKVKDFKKAIRQEIEPLNPVPFDCPVSVNVIFRRPNQKNISHKKKIEREMRKELPIVKPDLDNYIKSLFDALNGLYWTDDNLICAIRAYKVYSTDPGILITVEPLNDGLEVEG